MQTLLLISWLFWCSPSKSKSKKMSKRLLKSLGQDRTPLFWHADSPKLLSSLLGDIKCKAVIDLTAGDGQLALEAATRGACRGYDQSESIHAAVQFKAFEGQPWVTP